MNKLNTLKRFRLRKNTDSTDCVWNWSPIKILMILVQCINVCCVCWVWYLYIHINSKFQYISIWLSAQRAGYWIRRYWVRFTQEFFFHYDFLHVVFFTFQIIFFILSQKCILLFFCIKGTYIFGNSSKRVISLTASVIRKPTQTNISLKQFANYSIS